MSAVKQIQAGGTGVLQAYLETKKRIVVSRGGTRSSKTYSGAQLGVLWLIWADELVSQGYDFPTKGHFSYVRKTLPALKASAYRDFVEILDDNDLRHRVDENKSELTFSYKGRTVEFFSIDQPQKVRSRKRAIIYVPEANELDYKNDFQQLIFRTTHRFYLDFNPDDEEIWINTKLEQQRFYDKKDVSVIVSNYTHNPYLSKEVKQEIEYTRETDPELWQVYGLGEYGKITGLCYQKAPSIIDSFPRDLVKTVFYGLDFGYTDPMAMVRLGINGNDLYIEQLYYHSHRLTSDLIEVMPSLGVERKALIYADSAQPGSIQEIFNAGYRGIKGSRKGKGSRGEGVKLLKKYNWHVVASRDNKVLWERKRYRWATDKNGDIITPETPQDGNDHALDAIRYGVFTHTWQPRADNDSLVV
jgi:phage terminase large subunit